MTVKSKEKVAYRWLIAQSKDVRTLLVANIICALAIAVTLVAQAAFLALIIEKIVIYKASLDDYQIQLFCLLGFTLLRALLIFARQRLGFTLATLLKVKIRTKLLIKLRTLGPQYSSQFSSGYWGSILLEQVENLQDFFALYLPQMTLAVATVLGFIAIVLPINWAAASIFLVTAPLIPLFMILVGLGAADANRKNFQALSRLSAHFLDRLKGLSTLKLYYRAKQEQAMVAKAADNFRVKTMKVLRLAFLSALVLEFFSSVSIALVAVYLGMTYLGYLSFGNYGEALSLFTGLFILLLAPEFYQPLRDLGSYYHARAQAIGAADAMISLLAEKTPQNNLNHSSRQNKDLPQIGVCGQNIEVKGEAERILLKDLNFEFKPNSTSVIIGASGAGKTTWLNLLLGFQDFTGSLKFTNSDHSSVAPSIGWLGQHPQLFYKSIRDNVLLGRKVSETILINTLIKSQAWDFIKDLPEGLDTLINEDSSNLSVGQAQRIALARAILPPCNLLILDEPTAALDRGNEKLLWHTLLPIMAQCTSVLVTHRLDQAICADQIYVLEQGYLVQSGDLAQLIEDKSGPFEKLKRYWQVRLEAGGKS